MAQYIYGKNTVIQLLKSSRAVERLLLQEHSRNEEIAQLARKGKVRTEYLSKAAMDALVTERHQGVIALVEEYQTYTVDELLNKIPSDKLPLLIMLDGLEDPHNLGAILRTCDAAGVDGVILRKHRSVTLNATVAKVSCGAIDTVCVAETVNLTDTIKYLKKRGYWVCGADNNEALDYRIPDYRSPILLVIGSEGAGISRLVKQQLDYSVKLPMLGQISSLNASVATGIMLYQINNQRYPLNKGETYGRRKSGENTD